MFQSPCNVPAGQAGMCIFLLQTKQFPCHAV
jgi:hypothetical protein